MSLMYSRLRLALLLGSAFWIDAGGEGVGGELQQGMVVHLPLNDDFGDTAARGITPQPVGSPLLLPNGKIGSSAARLSVAPSASPGGGIPADYITLADDAFGVLNFGEFSDFAVAFWVRSGPLSGVFPLVANRDWSSIANTGWGVALGSGGRLLWNYTEAGNGADSRVFESASHLLDDSLWHHVVVSFQRQGDATTFLDGQLLDTRPLVQLDELGDPIPGVIDSGFGVAVGQDGTGVFVDPAMVSKLSIDVDDLGIWQRALTAEEVDRLFTFAQRGRDLDQVLDSTLPFVSSGTPLDGDSNSNPEGRLNLVLQDSFTSLVESSVRVYLDDQPVVHQLSTLAPGTHQLSYLPPRLLPSSSDHHYEIRFTDNDQPPHPLSIDLYFTIGQYRNFLLPKPIFLEDFDGTPDAPLDEGTVPEGWTVENASDHRTPFEDLEDKSSESYVNWTVVTGDRAVRQFGANRGLIRNWQVVNDQVLTNLIERQFCYANSGGRPGVVYQILYSPDIDLSGHTNVFLVYHSIYTQNQDSMGSVEYSLDQGQTWQPVVYMLDGSPSGDIAHTEEGWVDPVLTLTRPQRDAVRYVDPVTSELSDGSYGSFIGVTPDRFETLGPYISARFDDDQLESKRVEFFRLPLADGQAQVRLRFMNCGTDSWYFGIDHVGLYSLESPVPELSMSVSGNFLYLEWGPFGVLQAASDLAGPWVDLTAVDHTYKVPTQVDAQFYRVITR